MIKMLTEMLGFGCPFLNIGRLLEVGVTDQSSLDNQGGLGVPFGSPRVVLRASLAVSFCQPQASSP